MEPPPEQNNSNEQPPVTPKPFPGSLTPGWNDPPPLPTNMNVGAKRKVLNKRVAFPLQSNEKPTSSTAAASNATAPPRGGSNSTMPLPLKMPNNALEQITNQFNESIQMLSLDKQQRVKEHFQIMQNLWNANKLSQQVKLIVYRFSLALGAANVQAATSELTLMQTTHYEECSTWISAFYNIFLVLYFPKGTH